jgi:hypothetical protein
MTEPTTNPDAEAAAAIAAAKLKTPPIPGAPSPAVAAAHAAAAAPLLVTNPAAITAAQTAIQTAITEIAQAGNVTSDLSLATASCKQALNWLAKATVAAAAAAPKA